MAVAVLNVDEEVEEITVVDTVLLSEAELLLALDMEASLEDVLSLVLVGIDDEVAVDEVLGLDEDVVGSEDEVSVEETLSTELLELEIPDGEVLSIDEMELARSVVDSAAVDEVVSGELLLELLSIEELELAEDVESEVDVDEIARNNA